MIYEETVHLLLPLQLALLLALAQGCLEFAALQLFFDAHTLIFSLLKVVTGGLLGFKLFMLLYILVGS